MKTLCIFTLAMFFITFAFLAKYAQEPLSEPEFVEGKTVFCSCGDMKYEYYWNEEIRKERNDKRR